MYSDRRKFKLSTSKSSSALHNCESAIDEDDTIKASVFNLFPGESSSRSRHVISPKVKCTREYFDDKRKEKRKFSDRTPKCKKLIPNIQEKIFSHLNVNGTSPAVKSRSDRKRRSKEDSESNDEQDEVHNKSITKSRIVTCSSQTKRTPKKRRVELGTESERTHTKPTLKLDNLSSDSDSDESFHVKRTSQDERKSRYTSVRERPLNKSLNDRMFLSRHDLEDSDDEFALKSTVSRSTTDVHKHLSYGTNSRYDDEQEKLHSHAQRDSHDSFSSKFRRSEKFASSRRNSERFTSTYKRRNVSERVALNDSLNCCAPYHSRGSISSLDGLSMFAREFKSNFYEKLDEDNMEDARNVLSNELNSNIPFVDTHCHIDFLFKRLSFRGDVNEYAETTFFKFPHNFEGCIADWCQPSLYPQARSILKHDDEQFNIWGAFGCHPHFVANYNDSVEKQIEFHLSSYDKVIAWGEMGLDYSDRFGPTDHELQKEVFIQQLKVATRKYQCPLVIHCRDADKDLVKIMRQYVPTTTKIHRHCLTTTEKDVRPLLDYFPNCYVGFTNLLTNKTASKPREAAQRIPLDRILLETDAPYFIPRCVTQKSKGNAKWSHPAMASSVACELANIKNIPIDDVLTTIRDNVNYVYGI